MAAGLLVAAGTAALCIASMRRYDVFCTFPLAAQSRVRTTLTGVTFLLGFSANTLWLFFDDKSKRRVFSFFGIFFSIAQLLFVLQLLFCVLHSLFTALGLNCRKKRNFFTSRSAGQNESSLPPCKHQHVHPSGHLHKRARLALPLPPRRLVPVLLIRIEEDRLHHHHGSHDDAARWASAADVVARFPRFLGLRRRPWTCSFGRSRSQRHRHVARGREG